MNVFKKIFLIVVFLNLGTVYSMIRFADESNFNKQAVEFREKLCRDPKTFLSKLPDDLHNLIFGLIFKGATFPAYFAACHKACYSGSSVQLRELLDPNTGRDSERRNIVGELASILVEDDHVSELDLLSRYGGRYYSMTQLLHLAAKRGSKRVVRYLLDRGVDKDSRENELYTPLYRAASEGHASVVKILLDEGADWTATDCNYFPLNAAASRGHFDAVQLLLQIGAHRDYHNYTGGTPLFLAARNGHEGVVRLLLQAHADMEIDFEEKTPLFVAAENGHTNVVERLLEAGACIDRLCENTTALYVAAERGHGPIVDLLLKAGAQGNKCSFVDLQSDDPVLFCKGITSLTYSTTPLYIAAAHGHKGIVESLLNANASRNCFCVGVGICQEGEKKATEKFGETTALDIAVSRGHTEIARLLQGIGEPATSLFSAAERGDAEVVCSLCTGSDKNLTNENGKTALFIAAENGHGDVVQILLDNQADWRKTFRGKTPLDIAVLLGHEHVFQVLLNRQIQFPESLCSSVLTAARSYSPYAVNRLCEIIDRIKDQPKKEKIKKELLCAATLENHELIVRKWLHSEDEELLRWSAGDLLNRAVEKGHHSIVSHLFVQYRLVNDSPERTPIALDPDALYERAIRNEDVFLVKILVPNLCENRRDSDLPEMWLPLKKAVDINSLAVVRGLLYEYKRKKMTLEDDDLAVLSYSSIAKGRLDMLKAFVEAGADIESRREGITLLLAACEVSHYEIVDFLLQRKANPNVANTDGITPLLLVVDKGKVELVRLLLQEGANPNGVGLNCCPLLCIATLRGFGEIVELLLKAGAAKDITFNAWNLPYMARMSGDPTTIDVIARLVDSN